jgi:hypothetical protein
MNDEVKSLKEKVEMAIRLFMENDKELLDLKAHEQAVSHRIAYYLESLFKGYHVDCEYNRHGSENDSKKSIKNILNARENCKCSSCIKSKDSESSNTREKILVRPDIVVHERGNDDNNIVAIEVKKYDCLFDRAKLREFTDQNADIKYCYQLGLFLLFNENLPQSIWYVDGSETEDL